MSQNVNDLIQKIENEKKARKAIKLCDLDLVEVEEVEELDESYREVEIDFQYGKYIAYEKDGKIVFVKSLNEENNYGKKILIPHNVSDEEYSIILNCNAEKSRTLAHIISGFAIFSTFLISIFFVVIIIKLIKQELNFADFLSICITCLTPVFLTLFAFAAAKKLKE